MSFADFVETQNTKMAALLEKQFEQLLVAAAKHLKAHDDFKHYTQKALVEMMKGGDAPVTKKSATKKTKTVQSEDSESDDLELPEGLTKGMWAKVLKAIKEREEGQIINVKTGTCLKESVKTSKRYENYYFRGDFCAPAELKKVVLWCGRNQPEDEPEFEDETELEVDDESLEEMPKRRGRKAPVEDDDSSEDDQPPRRRGKGRKAPVEDDETEELESEEEPPRRGKGRKAPVEDDDELDTVTTSDGKEFTDAHLESLRTKAAEARKKKTYVNAESRRACTKNKRSEGKFVFYPKRGYAVPKANTDLQDYLDNVW